jgi:chromosome segregation ATPase
MILLALYITAAVKNKKTYNELVTKYNKLASYTDAEIKKRDEAVEHLVQTVKDNDHTIVKLQKELNDYSDKTIEQTKQIEYLNNEKNELLEEIEQLKIIKDEEPATTEAPSYIDILNKDDN